MRTVIIEKHIGSFEEFPAYLQYDVVDAMFNMVDAQSFEDAVDKIVGLNFCIIWKQAKLLKDKG